jgi:hypothetical protein
MLSANSPSFSSPGLTLLASASLTIAGWTSLWKVSLLISRRGLGKNFEVPVKYGSLHFTTLF